MKWNRQKRDKSSKWYFVVDWVVIFRVNFKEETK